MSYRTVLFDDPSPEPSMFRLLLETRVSRRSPPRPLRPTVVNTVALTTLIPVRYPFNLGAPEEVQRPGAVSVYLGVGSPTWRARALFRSKVDGCVPQTQHVNLKIVGQAK